MCQLAFNISSLTSSNYKLYKSVLYLSASISIDKTLNVSPMIMSLTYDPKNSTDVDHSILTLNDKSISNFKPKVYKLITQNIGSNAGSFLVTTS
jgi:hypothetical protein